MAPSTYHPTFFSHIGPGSTASARKIVPLLLGLTDIRSVVDVGCGTGRWLSIFAEMGVEDYLGIDGDYIDPATLSIPRERFRSCDLQNAFDLGRRFDLAISFEVAEHLQAEFAGTFVHLLTELAPLVAFSAAIPGQGGVGHVNEQWPDYWADLFAARGYVLMDRLRPQVWDDPVIEPWYRQNLFLYVAEDQKGRVDQLAQEGQMPLRVVHPEIFSSVLENPQLRYVLKSLPPAMKLSLLERWSRRPPWLGQR